MTSQKSHKKTDFRGVKRIRDFSSLSELISTLYQDKIDRIAKAAVEKDQTLNRIVSPRYRLPLSGAGRIGKG